MSPGRTPASGPLSRQRVLNAAVELADSEGLDTISMRRVAAQLGVVPMALYKHVADKADLVAGMIDTAVAGYPDPTPSRDWKENVRARVRGARAQLRRHPWLRQALASAKVRTPTVLHHMDAVAGELIAGGLGVDLTHYAMHVLGYRIWGFTTEAFSPAEPGDTATELEPSPEALEAMARAFPHIVAIAQDAAARNPGGACDDEYEFAFALDLILDAVERLHEAGWVSAPDSPSRRGSSRQ